MRTGILLATLGLVACEAEPFAVLLDSGSVEWGWSFGECIGYCREELRAGHDQIQVVATGWHPTDPPPPRASSASMDPGTWRTLQRLVQVAELDELAERYGCPDCTDGGAEWVELEWEGRRKRVEFEFGDPPGSLGPLVAYLRTLREQLPSNGFLPASQR